MSEPSVSIAQTHGAVEALRELWSNSTITDIDCDIDYFLAVAGSAEQVISPYVIRISRPDAPDILVAARLEDLPVRFGLGYWKTARVRRRAIVVAFDGILGTRGPDDEATAIATLRRLIEGGAADLLLMRNIDPQSTLHKAATGAVSSLRLALAQPVDRLWAASLPGTFDAFLSTRSAKSRSSFRREDRLLREEFGELLRLRRFARPEELDELCRDMERVAARTYQAGLGAGFANSPMERALVSLGLGKGSYRCWMLYVGERPVAFWAGMAQGNTFYPTTPGFDPDFARHSVGRYTMFRMIEDLCADEKISRLALGRGDAKYKTEYASVTRMATDVWLAARRPIPMMLVGALSLTAMINRHGRRAAENLKWSHHIKSSWRRRLATKSNKGLA